MTDPCTTPPTFTTNLPMHPAAPPRLQRSSNSMARALRVVQRHEAEEARTPCPSPELDLMFDLSLEQHHNIFKVYCVTKPHRILNLLSRNAFVMTAHLDINFKTFEDKWIMRLVVDSMDGMAAFEIKKILNEMGYLVVEDF